MESTTTTTTTATTSLESKYQNLAAEYSKLRANATVLKKAVLDEQARSRELKESLKEHEQRLRKSNQEMESLTFRNQQLTKRISVLQQELETKATGGKKPSRGKQNDANAPPPVNVTLLDEELQKKIMDNAQLISAMADKDFEISGLHKRLCELDERLLVERQEKSDLLDRHRAELTELRRKEVEPPKQNGDAGSDRGSVLSSEDGAGDVAVALATSRQRVQQLEQDLERCLAERELLNIKRTPHARQQEHERDETAEGGDADRDQRVKEHFYRRMDKAVADRQHYQSLSDSLATECNSLQARLELILEEKRDADRKLVSSEVVQGRLQEELGTTSHNYEQQLSTMSEHLADLNDKYTEQCELIHQLEFQLGLKSSTKKKQQK